MSYYTDPYLLTDLLNLQEQLNWNAFVETGTERGATARMLSYWIRDYYTCEPKFYKQWSYMRDSIDDYFKIYFDGKQNASDKNTCLWWNESSLTALPKIFNIMNENSNFYLYLDAHEDFSDNPSTVVLDELKIVAEHNLTPIIIIHDFDTKREGWVFYEFDGQSLDLEYVRSGMDDIYGNGNWSYHFNKRSKQIYGESNGCAYFYPKSLNINKN